jgi:hypothetical protein
MRFFVYVALLSSSIHLHIGYKYHIALCRINILSVAYINIETDILGVIVLARKVYSYIFFVNIATGNTV